MSTVTPKPDRFSKTLDKRILFRFRGEPFKSVTMPKRMVDGGISRNFFAENPKTFQEQGQHLVDYSEWLKGSKHPVDMMPDSNGKIVYDFKFPFNTSSESVEKVPHDTSRDICAMMKRMFQSSTTPKDRAFIAKFLRTYMDSASKVIMPDGKINRMAYNSTTRMGNIWKALSPNLDSAQAGNVSKQSDVVDINHKVMQDANTFLSTIDRLMKETTPVLEQQEREMPAKDEAFAAQQIKP